MERRLAALLSSLALACASTGRAPGDAPGTRLPDDPYLDRQLALVAAVGPRLEFDVASVRPSRAAFAVRQGIHADLPHAWARTTGSRDVIVAFLDDGFFCDHEDLAGNLWANPGESGLDERGYARETNGLDDDGNGYVDDVLGWDFAFADTDPDPYIFDGMDRSRVQPYAHSIDALGIVGARGNNGLGVAGVCWEVSLMLLKIGAQGTPHDEIDLERVGRAARAIRYAADNGARVVNWSGYTPDRRPQALDELRAAIRYAADKQVLLVVGAGNDAHDIDVDANAWAPLCLDEPNVLGVAELGLDGELYRYVLEDGVVRGSCWGRRRVQLAAIGSTYTTSLRDGRSAYRLGAGTSDAAPVVAGVAALVLSVRPDLGALELARVLIESATPLDGLRGKVESGGTVNAARALELALAR